METEYSNKEIIHLFSDLKGDLLEIKVDVKKTNGRVGSLENWRWFITGGLAVVTLVLIPLIFIVIQSKLK